MSVKINPVKSVLAECGNNGCGIHKMNDMCYGICNDYKDTDACREQCRDFIVNKRICSKGRRCPSKVVPRAPPIFNSVNDNFTPYLDKLGAEGSLKQCNSVCEKMSGRPYECKQKCRLNANAVVNFSIKNNERTISPATISTPVSTSGCSTIRLTAIIVLSLMVFFILSLCGGLWLYDRKYFVSANDVNMSFLY